jgi:hypothetical protein
MRGGGHTVGVDDGWKGGMTGAGETGDGQECDYGMCVKRECGVLSEKQHGRGKVLLRGEGQRREARQNSR